MEASCQEEAQWKKAEKRREKRWTVEREIGLQWLRGIKKKASAHEDARPIAHSAVGQCVKQDWGSSQIEEKFTECASACEDGPPEVLNKYKVEDSKREVIEVEWRVVGRNKRNIGLENRVKIAGQEFSHGSQSTVCSAYKV